MPPKQTKRVKGTVGKGTRGKKAKATPDAGGQSVSEKSHQVASVHQPSSLSDLLVECERETSLSFIKITQSLIY